MRRAALYVALGALVVTASACKGDDKRTTFRTTTTSSTTTSTSTTAASPATTNTTAAFAPAPGGCDASKLNRAEPRADRTRYEITAQYRPSDNAVSGELIARFTPDKATDRVYMRLWPNGPESTAHGGKVDLANASVDNAPLPLALEGATAAYVAKDLAAGEQVGVRVSFTVTLPVGSDDRLTRLGDVVRLGHWLPLLPWEPGVGWALEPATSAYAEASTAVPADFSVHLDVPDGLQVLASGTQIEPERWSINTAPDWAAVIGHFSFVHGNAGGVPVTVGVEQAFTEPGSSYLSRVISSINDLARRYGPFPYPSYNLALTTGMRGGIEYPGLVMQGPNSNARTTPHEVAHEWFYGLVGNNQGRDPWLDEGLATWAEAMFTGSYASFRSRSIPSDGRNRMGEPMTYWEHHQSSYYRSVYVQGLQALGALGVSTAAVDCALARYVAANAYRVATPQALADALKTVAPDAAAVLTRYGAKRVS